MACCGNFKTDGVRFAAPRAGRPGGQPSKLTGLGTASSRCTTARLPSAASSPPRALFAGAPGAGDAPGCGHLLRPSG